MTMRRAFVALVCLVLLVGIVAGQAGSSLTLESGTMTDDFEDGDLNEWDDNMGTFTAEIDASVALESNSVRLHDNGTNDLGDGNIETNGTFSLDTDQDFNITIWTNPTGLPEPSTGGLTTQAHGIRVSDGTETIYLDVMHSEGSGDTSAARVRGSLVNGNIRNTSAQAPNDVWTSYTVEVDYTADTITLYKNGTVAGTTDLQGNWSSPTNIKVRLYAQIDSTTTGENWEINYDDIEVAGVSPPSLTLDVQPFMEHGSTQSYTVTSETTDVTGEANLTSSDTSVITVDETAQELEATSDTSVNQQVTITAEFNGTTTTENVTVANLSVENLEILPDAIVRVSALFGNAPNADGDRPGGTQLTMQVLLVATMAGVAATVAASAFAGIGAMTIVLAMGWFQGWVGDGVMLGAVFTGLFIGLNLATNVDYSIRR